MRIRVGHLYPDYLNIYADRGNIAVLARRAAWRGHELEVTGLGMDDTIAPGNIFQNSNIPYKFANIRTVCHRLEATPFRPSWIRTPGRMQNTFANECFIDELAAAAGADPIAFRLQYLDAADKRGIEVLDRVAAMAKWDRRRSPQDNQSGDVATGRGVSKALRSLGLDVVEVEVRDENFQLPEGVDLAFNCIHGTFGEDGQEGAVVVLDLSEPARDHREAL